VTEKKAWEIERGKNVPDNNVGMSRGKPHIRRNKLTESRSDEWTVAVGIHPTGTIQAGGRRVGDARVNPTSTAVNINFVSEQEKQGNSSFEAFVR